MLGQVVKVDLQSVGSKLLVHSSLAEVGRLSWSVAESLRAFVERVIANFRDKNVVFYYRAETGNLWLLRDYYESRFSLR